MEGKPARAYGFAQPAFFVEVLGIEFDVPPGKMPLELPGRGR
jgi:hypothetical protein